MDLDALLARSLGGLSVAEVLSLGGLVAARVAPLTVFAPWLTLRKTPAVLRATLVLALTLALGPFAFQFADVPPDPPPGLYVLWLVREALVGTVFALASSLPLFALDWSGRLVDTWRGASMAEVQAPPTGERTSPLGDLLLLFGVAWFLGLGGHRVAFEAFAWGLEVAPVGAMTLDTAGGAGVALAAAELSGAALAFAMALAAPAFAAIVTVEVGLGLVARSAPQIQVFFLGMPLRAAVGLAALLLSLNLLAAQLPGAWFDALGTARSFFAVIAP